jgi:uncharacterized membrane protein
MCRSSLLIGLLIGFCSSAVSQSAMALPPAYTGALLWDRGDTNYHAPQDLNSAGLVSGAEGSPYRATLWDHGSVHDCGTTGGGIHSQFSAINSTGTAVGAAEDSSGRMQLMIWKNNAMTTMASLPGSISGYALSINSAETVVGMCWNPSLGPYGAYRAFTWSDGTIAPLGALTADGFSSARAISENGVIVGSAQDPAHPGGVPVRFDGVGGVTPLGMPPAAQSADAVAVNSSGTIAGYEQIAPGITLPLMWDGGGPPQVLPLLSGDDAGYAFDLNEAGQIVGQSKDSVSGRFRATLWDSGIAYDLQPLLPAPAGGAWLSTNASSITDAGEILITGQIRFAVFPGQYVDEYHAMVISPVPEPSFLGVLAIVGFAAISRRRNGATTKVA